jgi:hypothetical protein
MAFVIGSHADVTLKNVLIVAFNPDNSWAQVSLEPDADGNVVSVWIPTDSRISAAPIAPDNWPPVEGDIWTNGTVTAWVVAHASNLYFVTEANILNKTTPITTDQALARFGSELTRLYSAAGG